MTTQLKAQALSKPDLAGRPVAAGLSVPCLRYLKSYLAQARKYRKTASPTVIEFALRFNSSIMCKIQLTLSLNLYLPRHCRKTSQQQSALLASADLSCFQISGCPNRVPSFVHVSRGRWRIQNTSSKSDLKTSYVAIRRIAT